MTILLTPFHDIINLSEIYETEPLIYEKTKTFMDDPKTYESNPDSTAMEMPSGIAMRYFLPPGSAILLP